MIEELNSQLRNFIQAGNQKSVTVTRGRLIKAYKKEIKELEAKADKTDDEIIKLEVLKTELQKQINAHKTQLDARYSNEFIKKEMSLSKITEIPKNVAIAAKKVKACIDDLKLAKTNKQRVFKTLELIKSLGMLPLTPAIYLGKLMLKHWYIPFSVLSVLKMTDIDLLNQFAKENSLAGKMFGGLENVRNAPVIKPIYDGFDFVTDKAIDGLVGLKDNTVKGISSSAGFDYEGFAEEMQSGLSR